MSVPSPSQGESGACDRPKLNWFRVDRDAALPHLARWVKGQRVNTYNGPRQDKKGDWIILLGWDDKPDSDWGKFRGNRAAAWFATEALANEGETTIRKAWGWQT